MRIYFNGKWHTKEDMPLIVQLENKDKKNIRDMQQDCDIYCEYDEGTMSTEDAMKMLTKIKEE